MKIYVIMEWNLQTHEDYEDRIFEIYENKEMAIKRIEEMNKDIVDKYWIEEHELTKERRYKNENNRYFK